jgi:hypothetical protein
MQHACRPSGLVTRETAILEIGNTLIEADMLAGFRIDRNAVVIRREKDDRAIGHHLVQHLTRQVVLAENAGIPAMALHPLELRLAPREIGKPLLQFRDSARAGEIDIKGVARARILQMDMRILETRQHQPATRIDDTGRLAGERLDVGIRSQRHDPAVARSEGRNVRLQRIHGLDTTIDENEIRRHSLPPIRAAPGIREPAGPY